MTSSLNKRTNKSPFIIGLTGGIGSGKTTVANLFIELGVFAVDADVVAREVVMPGTLGLNRIIDRFGQDITLADGQLDRAKLRSIIFENPAEKEWLNKLLHPIIRNEIFSQLSNSHNQPHNQQTHNSKILHTNNTPRDYCLLIAPLLFENNLHLQVNRTLTIDVDEATQITRTILRDNCDESIIRHIIASQIPRQERLNLSDDIICNQDKTLQQLTSEVAKYDEKYHKLASRQKNGSKK